MKLKYFLILPVILAFIVSGISLAHAQVFTKNLYYGLQNNSQVIQLQEFLTSQNLYSGPITGNFYSLTLNAVKAFQARQGISPSAGYFGPITIVLANKIANTGVSTPNTQTIAYVPKTLVQQTSTPVIPASTTNQITQFLPFGVVLNATTTRSIDCSMSLALEAGNYTNSGIPYNQTSTLQAILGQGMNNPMTLFLQPDKDEIYVSRIVTSEEPLYGGVTLMVTSTIELPESWVYTGIGMNPITNIPEHQTPNGEDGWQPATSTPLYDGLVTSTITGYELDYSQNCDSARFVIPNPTDNHHKYYMFVDGGGFYKQYVGTLAI